MKHNTSEKKVNPQEVDRLVKLISPIENTHHSFQNHFKKNVTVAISDILSPCHNNKNLYEVLLIRVDCLTLVWCAAWLNLPLDLTVSKYSDFKMFGLFGDIISAWSHNESVESIRISTPRTLIFNLHNWPKLFHWGESLNMFTRRLILSLWLEQFIRLNEKKFISLLSFLTDQNCKESNPTLYLHEKIAD